MKYLDFCHDWYFGYAKNSYENRDYIPVTLPHDFSINLPIEKDCPTNRSGGYFPGGHGIYVKEFYIEAAEINKVYYILFEGIYQISEVWLNGNILGCHPYGYTSFYYKLNDYIKEGKNELKVFADNTQLPNSRWYSGSGIYRPVWLVCGSELHIKPWNAAVKTIDISKGIINVNAEIEPVNIQYKIIYNVIDSAGKTVVNVVSDDSEIEITIPDVKLWSCENPYLYKLQIELLSDSGIADVYETNFGIRSVEVDAENGLCLNGKSIKMKGGCVHHDNGIIGSASFNRSEERKVELLKKSGYNAVRCAHNPPAPSFLDACDKLGMLVIDEAFDCWKQPKNPYDYHLNFETWWQKDMESMVKRDRNHPSVIIWSIGNEVAEQYGTSGCYETARILSDFIRSIDNTRPITQAINGTGRNTDKTFEPLDIAGYNYDFTKYESDHELFPNRVMMGTETVAKMAYENWSKVVSYPYVIGDFVWTSMDYLGEAAIGRAFYSEENDIWNKLSEFPYNKAHCGDIDTCGFKRPQSYYRDFVWDVSDTPYIAVRRPNFNENYKTECTTFWGWNDNLPSWNFPGCDDKTMLVDVYSAGEKVKLYLNGNLIGEKPLYDTEERNHGFDYGKTHTMPRYAALFEVPYHEGELTAVSDNGKICKIKTAGKPSVIRLTADRDSIGFNNDLCYVTVEITDNEGIINPAADNKIYFSIDGGILLAVGTSNPRDAEPYTGYSHTVYDGKMMAVVRSSGKGMIKLKAMADNLCSAEIVINASK